MFCGQAGLARLRLASYRRRMKRFSLILAVLLVAAVFPLQAQDVAALEERVKRLTGYIQDLQEENANQKRQIDTLVRELSALREQVQNRPVTASASPEDLRELARKVQDIEKNREADRAFLEQEFKRLKQIASASAGSSRPAPPTTDPAPGLPKEAREHTIAAGDTLLAIALAYSKDTGSKITTDLILKANPGLDPRRMQVGQKILIPVP